MVRIRCSARSAVEYGIPTGQTSRCGFTFIELVITMLIVGILAAIGAPKFEKSLAGYRATTAAHRVQADLRYARRLAQRNCSPQTVTFDPATDSYTLPGVESIDRRGTVHSLSLNSDLQQADLVSADFAGNTSVTFDIFGGASNTGTVVVSSGNETRTITVNAAGIVSLE